MNNQEKNKINNYKELKLILYRILIREEIRVYDEKLKREIKESMVEINCSLKKSMITTVPSSWEVRNVYAISDFYIPREFRPHSYNWQPEIK